MPVRRDTQGKIVDEPTRRVSQPDQKPAGVRRVVDITGKPETAPTVPVGGPPLAGGRYDVPTTRIRDERGQPAPDADRTRLVSPGKGPTDEDVPAGDPMDDPPVGWLVVVDGPGKGSVATLGIGVNSVGRDPSERVSLDYGDKMISRAHHGTITYDPRGRKFYVQHGGGKNLTYVDEEPVLAPRELAPLTQLQMGDTVLRFVPLCGAAFSWDDDSNGE